MFLKRNKNNTSKRSILGSCSSASCDGSRSQTSSKLFQPGAKIIVQRAPLMNGLSLGTSVGVTKPFQRPLLKRRAYTSKQDEALRRSSLGQRKRMDGMAKLMARAGRGLTYKLPTQPSAADDTESDSDSDEEAPPKKKEPDQPYVPLQVWTSPHNGGESMGLPPTRREVHDMLQTAQKGSNSTPAGPPPPAGGEGDGAQEPQLNEFGIEEMVTVVKPAPNKLYSKRNVFVPEVLAKWLRPHQREGVQFMYECVMGLKDFQGNGCILADDMGLGKTLQSVALIYTLLKTGITANEAATAKRVIVVCPCSLVKNWENEFAKWLGAGTVKTLAIAEADRATVEKNLDAFVRTKLFNVLIASYECIRSHVGRLTKHADCCDLLVCDEAHRLKNRSNQTSAALDSLPVKRRVLLTGTPMQNDLEEFFAMVDFTNSNILGTPEEFRRYMMAPILRGREPDATEAQKQKMIDRQSDMSTIVNDFILRRTNTLNAQHLPPKLVQVVCCNLTDIQRSMYRHLVSSKDMQHVLNGKQVNCLGSIQMLMKLSNHPSLIIAEEQGKKQGGRRAAAKKIKYNDEEKETSAAPGVDGVAKYMPVSFEASRRGFNAPVHPEWSGKMFVLYRLMREMRKPGNGSDKIVIVSNYTQTLDLIGRMCRENSWGFCRLDGSTSMKRRDTMVSAFNDPSSSAFAFLLSSKAGGCGLNLIGGNRLVLFDPDWNPAVDKQAAARCWRDGQKKRCFTYRFLATGTVEEKIFQRQLSKEGLQSVVDDKEQVNTLCTKDLRNLFKLRDGTPSDTHDKLRCQRCEIIQDNAEMEALKKLPKQLIKCRELLDRMAKEKDAAFFLKPMNPQDHGVTKEKYEKSVKQPMDFGTIQTRLAQALATHGPKTESNQTAKAKQSGPASTYMSISEFSKDVNRVFENCIKVFPPKKDDDGEPRKDDVAKAARRLQAWWMEQWTIMVPILMSVKAEGDDKEPDNDNDGEEDDDILDSTAAINNERGENFQEQLGMPEEENMRSWSHHYSTDTVDDPVFRAAMRGFDSVSFVFGLEVTWSLIQQRQQEEEERQAMEELQAIQEMNETMEEAENETEGASENQADGDEGATSNETEVEDAVAEDKKEEESKMVEEDKVEESSKSLQEGEEQEIDGIESDGDDTYNNQDKEADEAEKTSSRGDPTTADDTSEGEFEETEEAGETSSRGQEAPSPSGGKENKTPGGQWMCEACSLLNSKRDIVCEACEAARPESPKKRRRRA